VKAESDVYVHGRVEGEIVDFLPSEPDRGKAREGKGGATNNNNEIN